MKRRRLTEREVLEVLNRQLDLLCYRCQGRMLPSQVEREHIVEIALGGQDTPANCAYSHKTCHAIVTNGTPATTAGSSKNRIAKANNENRRAKFVVTKIPVDQERPDKGKFGRRPFERRDGK